MRILFFLVKVAHPFRITFWKEDFWMEIGLKFQVL